MKRTTKTIGTMATMGIMLVCAYLLGTTKAETITEIQTVTGIREVIPVGYIRLDECIPLEDIACYFIDGYDYPCFELGDITHQLDDDNNRSYADIMESMADETEAFKEHFIDMQSVVDFEVNENGLQLYFADGSGYYWEK